MWVIEYTIELSINSLKKNLKLLRTNNPMIKKIKIIIKTAKLISVIDTSIIYF